MKKSKDRLGDRQKAYENVYRTKLPKGMPLMIRLDGRAFHTYTKGFKKPFDEVLAKAMWEAAKAVCEEIPGAKMAYTQSDEITVFINNYEDVNKEYWYDNNLQKVVSVSASIASGAFNDEIRKTYPEKPRATFDSRAWVLPKEEVFNAINWRMKDCTKNSVAMLAQANFHHNELQGLNSSQLQDKLFLEKGINWNDLPTWQKRGVAVVKVQKPKNVTYNGETFEVMRNVWEADMETPIFSKDRNYIDRFVYEEKDTLNPRKLEGKWYLEIDTEDFGRVLLLDPNEEAPIPIYFDTEEDALDYKQIYQQKQKRMQRG